MNKDFSHLTPTQLIELRDRYYAGEVVKELEKEYDLSFPLSSRVSNFPPIQYHDRLCPYCAIPMISTCRTRRHLDSMVQAMSCPTCGHAPNRYFGCKCTNCQKVEQEKNKKLQEELRQYYSVQPQPVDFCTLSLKNKIYLGALCRELLSEDLSRILPLRGSNKHLSPTTNLTDQIYTSLLEAGAIIVSPNSPITAFDLEHTNFPTVFLKDAVEYRLNLAFPEKTSELITDILSPTYYSSENPSQEIQDIHSEIAVSECIEYLLFQMNSVHFSFSPGERTYKTFEIILQDFSVSQTYGIIWKAVADASKQYLERRYTKQHAANIVIGSCERYAARAKLNNWQLPQYRRPREIQQSALSHYFYYRVINIGDDGFNSPLHKFYKSTLDTDI